MLQVACRCGRVRATLDEPSPRALGRIVCYCADCQAFAHHLGRADLLNEKGGSDIVPVAPASLVFREGRDRIAAVRLSPRGPHRFYATCCNTPVGAIFGESAVGGPPPGSKGVRFGFMLTAILRIVGWRLAGKVWPHPFFDRESKKALYPVTILTREQRDALRPKCGPTPAVS
mgnify:CR=1 FL=1